MLQVSWREGRFKPYAPDNDVAATIQFKSSKVVSKLTHFKDPLISKAAFPCRWGVGGGEGWSIDRMSHADQTLTK